MRKVFKLVGADDHSYGVTEDESGEFFHIIPGYEDNVYENWENEIILDEEGLIELQFYISNFLNGKVMEERKIGKRICRNKK